MGINNDDTSLFGLEVDELDAIVDDIELYFNGYKLFYAVDTYDFVHFFLPYLAHMEFSSEKINLMAREGIAYENFFSPAKMGSILLLDEYKTELQGIRDVFIDRLQNAVEFTANFSKLSEQIRQLIESGKSFADLANENFDLFFLLLIFCQRKSELKELNFFKFLKRNIYVDNFQTEDEEFNIAADAVFSVNDGQQFINTIFDLFMEQQYKAAETENAPKYFNWNKYRANTMTDIRAIEKVLTANELISRDPTYHKTVFYYLSSAQAKSTRLFQLIHDTFGPDLPFLGIFRHSGKGIHRNIMQVFLFNMLVAEYPHSREMPIRILSQIKKNRRKNAGQKETDPQEDAPVVDALSKILQKYSSFIENHIYNTLITSYKDTLKEILDEAGTDGSQLQLNVFGALLSVVEENKKEAENATFLYTFKKYGQIMLLKEAIARRSDNLSRVRIRFGKDIVRFNYHHLPYLLFVYDSGARNEYESFYTAMQEISGIDTAEENYIEEVIRFLEELFATEKTSNIRRNTYGVLMLTYLDFLSIGIQGEEDSPNVEPDLINSLEIRLKIIQPNERKPAEQHQSADREKATVKKIRNELYYVLIWLYRRNNLFDKLFQLEKEIKKERIADARLWHGLGLAYEAYFYDRETKPEDKELLDKTIQYLRQAETEYLSLLERVRQPTVRNLIIRNLIGICNSMVDTYIQLYYVQKNAMPVRVGREYLQKIKNDAQSLKVDYDQLTIVNNTEAELEYCEATLLAQSKEIGMARKKLGYAFKRYNKSVIRDSTMHPKFRGLIVKLEQLRRELKS